MNLYSVASPDYKLEEGARICANKFTRIASKKVNQHLQHIMKRIRYTVFQKTIVVKESNLQRLTW